VLLADGPHPQQCFARPWFALALFRQQLRIRCMRPVFFKGFGRLDIVGSTSGVCEAIFHAIAAGERWAAVDRNKPRGV
jgi:hypothetical protein